MRDTLYLPHFYSSVMQLKKLLSLLLLCPSLSSAANYFPPNNQEELDLASFTSVASEFDEKKEGMIKAYQAATDLIQQQKLDKATVKINALIKSNPEETAPYILRALVQGLKKDNSAAIQTYLKILELAPNSLKAHLGLATTYFSLGDLSLAKQYAMSAISLNNKLPQPDLLLAEIAVKEKNAQDLEKFLLSAQQKASKNSEQAISISDKLIQLYFAQKQAEKALAIAESTIKQFPNNSTALALLAKTQIVNKQTELAVLTLEKLTQQEPKDAKHRLLLARLISKSPEKQQQALTLLNEAEAIAPDKPQIIAQKAAVLTQLKLFPEALQSAAKVKQLSPETGAGEILEAEVYLSENKLDLALREFQKSYAIKANPKVLGMITKIMLKQGKLNEAIEVLEQALEKEPDNLGVHFAVGNIYQQQNNNTAAEKHYQTVLAKYPDNPLALNNLAWIYYQEGKPKALSLAEKAYQKAPKSPAIIDTYGLILVSNGQIKKGLKMSQEAAKLAPKSNEIQYNLAKAYIANKQKQAALDILNVITLSEQDFPEKQAAIDLLNQLK